MVPEAGAPPDAPAPGRGRARRVFWNTAVNGAGVAFTVALSFFLVPFAIDRLGGPAYGIWVLALSFSLTGGYLSLTDLGLHESVVKHVAEADALDQRDRLSQVASSALAAFAVTGVVALLLASGLALVAARLFNVPSGLGDELRLLLLLVAVDAVLGLPGLAFQGVLAGLQRFGAIRLVDATRQVVYAVIVVTVLLRGNGVIAFGAAMTISTLVGTVGYAIAARRVAPDLVLAVRHVRRSVLRELASFGSWVFASKIISVLWRQMDKVILASVLVSNLLTDYDVANKIQATAAVLLSFSSSAVMPATSALHAGSEDDRLRELLQRGTRYSVALALPVVVGAMVLAEPLLVHWVGPEFGDVADVTRLFLAYQLLASAASVALTVLVGMGRIRTVTLYVAVAAVVNLTLSIVLARPLGIAGVVIGTLVGYGITGPLYLGTALRMLRLRVGPFLAHSVLPLVPWAVLFAALTYAVSELFPPTGLLAVFLVVVPAALVYVVGVWWVVLSDDERQMLTGFVRPASAPTEV